MLRRAQFTHWHGDSEDPACAAAHRDPSASLESDVAVQDFKTCFVLEKKIIRQ